MMSGLYLLVPISASSGALASSVLGPSSSQQVDSWQRKAHREPKRLMRSDSHPWDDGIADIVTVAQTKKNSSSARPSFNSKDQIGAEAQSSIGPMLDKERLQGDDLRPEHPRAHLASSDEDAGSVMRGLRRAGKVWTRKIKARMIELERAMQRLEKAEAKQDSKRHDFEKVFGNLKSLVHELFEENQDEVAGRRNADWRSRFTTSGSVAAFADGSRDDSPGEAGDTTRAVSNSNDSSKSRLNSSQSDDGMVRRKDAPLRPTQLRKTLEVRQEQLKGDELRPEHLRAHQSGGDDDTGSATSVDDRADGDMEWRESVWGRKIKARVNDLERAMQRLENADGKQESKRHHFESVFRNLKSLVDGGVVSDMKHNALKEGEDVDEWQRCIIYDKYGEEYVKHHAGPVRCLEGGIPLFKTHPMSGGEYSLLSTVSDWMVEFCDLDEFDDTQYNTLCSDGGTKPICPCECQGSYNVTDDTDGTTTNYTLASCLPTKAAFDVLLASKTYIRPQLSGHPDGGVPFIFLKDVVETEVEDFIGNINFPNKGYKAKFAEADRFVANDQRVTWLNAQKNVQDLTQELEEMDEYPEKSQTCALQKTADSWRGNTMIKSWGLDRIDDEEGLDCRSMDSDSGPLGEGVNIWILDTGILATHVDFEDRATQVIDLTQSEQDGVVKVCKDQADPKACGKDVNGHGTHCGGTAAGKTVGVARKAKILGAKVLGDNKDGKLSWIIAGVDYAIEDYQANGQKPTIISMSLGGVGQSASMRAAVDKAIVAGIVVTVAAGNQGDDACNYNPAFVPDAITVAATTWDDGMPDFSNYGKCIDILAPGKNILSDWPTDTKAEKDQSGTSMACPHVTGAAALILSFDPTTHKKSKATQDAILEKLLDMSTKDYVKVKPDTVNKLLNVGQVKEFTDPNWMRFSVAATFGMGAMAFIAVCGVLIFCCHRKSKKKDKKGKT